MKFSRAFLCGIAMASVAGCSKDPVSKEVTPEPSAAVRFVNAVPDTVAMDYRFTDYPSNASEPSLAFQSSSGNWRIIPGGTHQVTAFFTNTTAAGDGVSIVSQIIDQNSFNLAVGKKYTILHYGFAKSGASPQKTLKLIEDNPPAVAAGQVAIRIINATAAPVDVYAGVATSTNPAPGSPVSGTPAFSNVAAGGVTNWVSFPIVSGSNSYRVVATAVGSTASSAETFAPPGVAAIPATPTTAAFDAVPGTRIGQSGLTIVVFGPRVAYVLKTPSGGTSNVPGTATGAMTALLDVWPPRISP